MGFFEADIRHASHELQRTVEHILAATHFEVESLFRKADKLAKRAGVEAGIQIESTHQSVQQILRFDVPYAARAGAEGFVDGLVSKLFGTVPRQGLLRKEVLKMLNSPHATLRSVLDLIGNQEVTPANELWECYQTVFDHYTELASLDTHTSFKCQVWILTDAKMKMGRKAQPVAKQCYRKNTNDKNKFSTLIMKHRRFCFVAVSYFLIVDVF